MISTFFYYLFHVHKWVEFRTGNIVDHRKIAIGTYHDQKCERCGALRKVQLTT